MGSLESDRNEKERKKQEVVKRFMLWKGMPNPWEALAGSGFSNESGNNALAVRMHFTIEEAEYVFWNLDQTYRLEFLFYLILDDGFVGDHRDWISQKMAILDGEFSRHEKAIIFLQMKRRMKKTKEDLCNHH